MTHKSVVNCTVCNKEFRPRAGKANKYCSTACYRTWQRGPDYASPKKVTRIATCTHCGQEVRGKSMATCRDGRKSDKIFCDRNCYNNHRSAVAKRLIEANSRKCKGCINTVSSTSPTGKVPTYCSFKCRNLHIKPATNKCVNCKVSYSAIQWRENRKGKWAIIKDGVSKTCSPKCYNLWIRNNPERKRKISEAFKGSKHPNWMGGSSRSTVRGYRGAGWLRIAESIRKRDSYQCQRCGITQADSGKKLDVHHKIPFNQFQGNNAAANKSANLEALCNRCHAAADSEWRKANPVQLVISI